MKRVLWLCAVVAIGLLAIGCLTTSPITGSMDPIPLEGHVRGLGIDTFAGDITFQAIPPGEQGYIQIYKEVRGTMPTVMRNAFDSMDVEVDALPTSSHVAINITREEQYAVPAITKIVADVTIAAPEAQLQHLIMVTNTGDLKVQQFTGRLEATTESGSVTLRQVDLSQPSSVRANKEAITGRVRFSADGLHSFETAGADISLTIVPDFAGTARLTAENGTIRYKHRAPVPNHFTIVENAHSDLELRASTRNGSIRIMTSDHW